MDAIPQVYLAKYPYFEESKAVLESFDVLEAIEDPEIITRATERVVRGVNDGFVESLSRIDANPGLYPRDAKTAVDIQSFPVARILVSLIGDYRIVNRYAEAESKTARVQLKDDVISGRAAEERESRNEQSAIATSQQTVTLHEALEEFGITAIPTTLADEVRRTTIQQFFETASDEVLSAFAQDQYRLSEADVDSIIQSGRSSRLSAKELYHRFHERAQTPQDTEWFRIGVEEYIRVAVGMSDAPEWRLTNRGVVNGTVLVTKTELFDLFQQAVHQRVSERLPLDVPEKVAETIRSSEPFAGMSEAQRPEYWEDIPVGPHEVSDTDYDYVELVRSAINEDNFSYEIDRVAPGLFPPVIDRLLEGVRKGENLKHEARFTLAAFLLNIGMNEDEIVDMFGVGGSYGEGPTRYQVGQIQRGGGSGEPYTPANYATMESWGIDWEKDALEAKVTNPLTYYKIKLKEQDEQESEGDSDTDSDAEESADPIEVKPKKQSSDGAPPFVSETPDNGDEA